MPPLFRMGFGLARDVQIHGPPLSLRIDPLAGRNRLREDGGVGVQQFFGMVGHFFDLLDQCLEVFLPSPLLVVLKRGASRFGLPFGFFPWILFFFAATFGGGIDARDVLSQGVLPSRISDGASLAPLGFYSDRKSVV